MDRKWFIILFQMFYSYFNSYWIMEQIKYILTELSKLHNLKPLI